MSRDFDYRVQAEEAMRKAAAAPAVVRIKWVRLALARQDLERGEDQDAARSVTR